MEEEIKNKKQCGHISAQYFSKGSYGVCDSCHKKQKLDVKKIKLA